MQHEITEETQAGVQRRRRAALGVFLLLCHTGAFYSESSPHQETDFCFLCANKLHSYLSLETERLIHFEA